MSKGLAAINTNHNNEATLMAKFPGQLPYRLGPMDHTCKNCGALRWGEERSKENIRLGSESYLNCCQYGAVTLPLRFMPGGPLPPELLHLYTASDTGKSPNRSFQLALTDR
ncbi:hypothetical protein DFH28DRAFT_895723 [Melampsora americana]|nr:hypothetical protein DFH28DRAFT_915060 [Melampsora americana]KAH9813834.1 hypothetical protein DFH28DRAFT_895723 [Melampsora americana]